jgi:hypothetical protein
VATRVAKRRIAALAIGGAAVAAVTVGTTSALLTDNETVGNNVFSSATFDLTASPTSAAFTFSAMVPGDAAVAPLTIKNNGTTPLRYALASATGSGTGGAGGTGTVFASNLNITVKTGVATCDKTNFAATGSAVSTTLPLGPSTKVFGDAVTGQNGTANAVGADRTLAPGVSEVLCVKVELPIGAVNDVTGQSTTATLTFAAEQTNNN